MDKLQFAALAKAMVNSITTLVDKHLTADVTWCPVPREEGLAMEKSIVNARSATRDAVAADPALKELADRIDSVADYTLASFNGLEGCEDEACAMHGGRAGSARNQAKGITLELTRLGL
ncbi:hypothetical protein HNP46_000252 [Pseudomonas nitritireducens]|uniref:Uncharacterized protein n=1 Tax=Pseudomonas nitroreducens TaxID=46680 RepID=A0A7W7NYG6_PSENT|nr:hypothetical protein [Pseudomonas nitritireducens]MBB4861441.1 hypothetical protein [Pseudomonas nitritireducens]